MACRGGLVVTAWPVSDDIANERCDSRKSPTDLAQIRADKNDLPQGVKEYSYLSECGFDRIPQSTSGSVRGVAIDSLGPRPPRLCFSTAAIVRSILRRTCCIGPTLTFLSRVLRNSRSASTAISPASARVNVCASSNWQYIAFK